MCVLCPLCDIRPFCDPLLQCLNWRVAAHHCDSISLINWTAWPGGWSHHMWMCCTCAVCCVTLMCTHRRVSALILLLRVITQEAAQVDKVITGWVRWFYCCCLTTILQCPQKILLLWLLHTRRYPVAGRYNQHVAILLLWLQEHRERIKSSFLPFIHSHCQW